MSRPYAVDFLSTYRGVTDYDVFVTELRRGVRVHRDHESETLTIPAHELTPDQAERIRESVRHYLTVEHARFLEWAERNGLSTAELTGRGFREG